MADMKAAKQKRSTAKGTFHRYLNTFNDILKNGAEEDALVKIVADAERAYGDVEEKHDALMQFYDSEDEDVSVKEKINQLNGDVSIMYKELCTARNEVAIVKKKQKVKEMKPVISKTEEVTKMKVKPLQAPMFNGNVRDYPSFKRDYDTHMVKYYGKDTFSLKTCLSGEALQLVLPVDDDYEEMIRRLDFKYGRPEKLVDVILNELKSLKKVDDDDRGKFCHMVDIIERCYFDLKKVNLQSEINSTTMLGLFEKKLPDARMHDWALVKQKVGPGKKQFEVFLEFLRNQRTAMEYADEHIRQNNSTKGSVNTAGFHTEIKDNNNFQAQLDQIVKGLAHVAEIVKGSNSEDKDARRIPPNPIKNGCFFHNSGAHDTKDCEGFKRLSVKERFELTQTSRACFSCLRLGHPSRNCQERIPCNKVNPTDRTVCSKPHHPLLHVDRTSLNAMAINQRQEQKVLLMLGKTVSRGVTLNILYDPGATLSLISRNAAKQLALKGSDISLSITKVGNSTDIQQSKEYTVPLKCTDGKICEVNVCEIEEITTITEEIDSKLLHSIFPEVLLDELDRPVGSIDMLIGADCCSLFPLKIRQVQELQLMKGPLGYCVRGFHESATPSNLTT